MLTYLLAVHGKRHWAGGAQARAPGFLSVAGVQRDELAVASTGEEQIAGRGQHTAFRVRRSRIVWPAPIMSPDEAVVRRLRVEYYFIALLSRTGFSRGSPKQESRAKLPNKRNYTIGRDFDAPFESEKTKYGA
jgi:hypothetical protein